MVFCSIVTCVHLLEYTVPSIRQMGSVSLDDDVSGESASMVEV
jgi:hypothetical protein